MDLGSLSVNTECQSDFFGHCIHLFGSGRTLFQGTEMLSEFFTESDVIVPLDLYLTFRCA